MSGVRWQREDHRRNRRRLTGEHPRLFRVRFAGGPASGGPCADPLCLLMGVLRNMMMLMQGVTQKPPHPLEPGRGAHVSSGLGEAVNRAISTSTPAGVRAEPPCSGRNHHNFRCNC